MAQVMISYGYESRELSMLAISRNLVLRNVSVIFASRFKHSRHGSPIIVSDGSNNEFVDKMQKLLNSYL